MKTYSTLLIIREIKFKITMRYHFIPTVMAKIKRQIITKVVEDQRNRNHHILLWEGKIAELPWKAVWQFL